MLINLIEMLQNEHDTMVKRTKEDILKGEKKSMIEKVFGGFYLNTLLCLDCMRVSRTREALMDISVTI